MGNLKLKCRKCERYLVAHSSYNTSVKRRPIVTIMVDPCKYCLTKAGKKVHAKAVKRVREDK